MAGAEGDVARADDLPRTQRRGSHSRPAQNTPEIRARIQCNA